MRRFFRVLLARLFPGRYWTQDELDYIRARAAERDKKLGWFTDE